MRFRETSAMSVMLPLVLSLLLAGLLAGCGGGDESGGGQQGGDKGGGGSLKKEKLSKKIAIGTVRAYKDDRRRLSLRPAAEDQGDKPLGFKVRKKAQVRYVVENGVNRAIIVQLFSKQQSGEDKKRPGEDKNQDQPSGGDDSSG